MAFAFPNCNQPKETLLSQMAALLGNGLSIVDGKIVVSPPAEFTPLSLGPDIWVDASKEEYNVPLSQLTDFSGKGNHVGKNGSDTGIGYFGGRKGVQMTANASFVRVYPGVNNVFCDPFTLFYVETRATGFGVSVGSWVDSSPLSGFWLGDYYEDDGFVLFCNTNTVAHIENDSVGGAKMLGLVYDGTTACLHRQMNEVACSGAWPQITKTDEFVVGDYFGMGNGMEGAMHEIVLIPRAISAHEVASLKLYLAHKWLL